MNSDTLRRRTGLWLAFFTLLFLLRVLGQLLVAVAQVRFLPAMEHWYSGLIPYPVLLPIQTVMLIVMAWLVRDVLRAGGFFAVPSARAGVYLRRFSYIYFLAMALRYVVTMTRYPELRWFGHSIPVVFHMVLAAFLYTYAGYHTRFSVPAQGEPQ